MGPVDESLLELARRMNLAPEELLARAVERASEKGTDLASGLVEMGLVTPERIKHLTALAEKSALKCAVHDDKPAVAVCSSCRKAVCKECVEKRKEGVFCSECGPQLDQLREKLARVKRKKKTIILGGAAAGSIVLISLLWLLVKHLAASGNYEAGIAALNAGDAERAENALKACLSWKDDFRDCRFKLGVALRQMEKAEESAEQLARYVDSHPYDALAHAELARSRRLAGDAPGSRKAYAKAFKLALEDAALARERALFMADSFPDEDETLDAVEASLELDGEDREVLSQLGRLLEKRGEDEEAYKALSRALSPDVHAQPREKARRERIFMHDAKRAAPLRLRAARLALKLGKEGEAFELAKTAHDAAPKDVDVACFYSKMLLGRGNRVMARSVLTRLGERHAADPRCLRRMRDLARALRDRPALKSTLGKLISIDPADEDSALEYVGLCLADGDLAKVKATLNGLQGSPSPARRLLRLKLGYASGDVEDSLSRAKALLDKYPDSPGAAAAVAAGLRMTGELLTAYRLAKGKLDAGIESSELFREAGLALWAAGFPQLAEELLEKGGVAGRAFVRRLRAIGWVRPRSDFESEFLERIGKLAPIRYADTASTFAWAKCVLYQLARARTGTTAMLEKSMDEARRWVRPGGGGQGRADSLGAEARRLAEAEAEAARSLCAALGARRRLIDPKDVKDPFVSAEAALKAQGDVLADSLASTKRAQLAIPLECLDGRARVQRARSEAPAHRAVAMAQRLVELLALEVSSGPTGFAYSPLARRTVAEMWERDSQVVDIMAQFANAELAAVRLLLLQRARQAEGPAFLGVELEGER